MTTILRSRLQSELAWTWTDHVATLPIVDSNRLRVAVELADGNAAQQADAVWHAAGESLADGQSTVYPLNHLPQNLFGATIAIPLAKVKAILIVHTTASASGHLLLGGAATSGWEGPFGNAGDQIKVPAGSPLLLANLQDGWTVGGDETDLRITAVGGAATYDIAILGTLPET